jgi:hypothetical protein
MQCDDRTIDFVVGPVRQSVPISRGNVMIGGFTVHLGLKEVGSSQAWGHYREALDEFWGKPTSQLLSRPGRPPRNWEGFVQMPFVLGVSPNRAAACMGYQLASSLAGAGCDAATCDAAIKSIWEQEALFVVENCEYLWVRKKGSDETLMAMAIDHGDHWPAYDAKQNPILAYTREWIIEGCRTDDNVLAVVDRAEARKHTASDLARLRREADVTAMAAAGYEL